MKKKKINYCSHKKAAGSLAAFFVYIQNQSMRAVIFDMDGVISDTEPLQAQAEAEIMKNVGLTISVQEMIDRFSGVPAIDVWKTLYQENGIPLPNMQVLKKQKLAILSRIAIGNIREIPGSIALIRTLQTKKVPIAIASSSTREFIDIVLEELGLTEAFGVIVSGTEVSHGKPAPDIFLLAAKRLGMKPEDCIVIEDALRGVQAAEAAKIKCIGYKPKHSNQDLSLATFIVKDLRELSLEMIEAL